MACTTIIDALPDPGGHVEIPPDIAGSHNRYLFRAIDENGQVVDVYLSDRRDAASAGAFFRRALAAANGLPARVTSDKAKCYPPALRAVLPAAEQRCSKYLSNGLERDHQFLKGRVRPMRRFKTTVTSGPVLSGTRSDPAAVPHIL